MRALVLTSLLLSLFACSPAEPPESVAGRFWAATLSGDEAGAWDTSAPGTFDRHDFNAGRHHQMFDRVVLGQTVREGDVARVETRLEGIFFGEPDQVVFETVTLIHDGQWKVNYAATTSLMIGALLEEAASDADQSIRDAILSPDSSLGEAIRQDLFDDLRDGSLSPSSPSFPD